MAAKLNMMMFLTLATVAFFQSSSLAATYEVGDSLGWTIPPGGSVAYSTWAANKTFKVGDILVFNFSSGQHDVAQVTKAAFDACNGSNTILLENSSPANITLPSAGEKYFICTISGHCSAGQKLAINVNAASSSPAPQPSSTPSPSSSPVPEPTSSSSPAPPSRGPVTYTVGDSIGWNVPPGGAVAYQTWASNKTFFVGDILVFNFLNRTHNVAEVTKANYDSCNTNNTISLQSNPPVRINLTKAGEHYYICTFTGHCSRGQKLLVNVTGDTATATPPSSATPPSTATSPSSANPPSTSPTSPSPSTSTTPSSPSPTGVVASPPENSASSVGFAGLSATFLSIVFALWC